MNKTIRNAALLGASLFALNVAAERAVGQGPVMSLGGSVTGAAIGVQQKVRHYANSPAVTFISKGNLVMNVGGTSNNGTGYGAVAVLNFDRAKTAQDRVDEVYVYLNHDCVGNLKLGDTEGLVQTMMYSGGDILGGLGGALGDLEKFVNVTRGVSAYPSIAPVANKAPKIVWISPEMHGFQVGVDFTPSTKLYGRLGRSSEIIAGSGNVKNASLAPYAKNLVAAGLSYNKAFTNWNLGLYLVGHSGTAKNDNITINAPATEKYRDVRGYQVGALIDYQNWQVGGSYFDNQNSYVRSNSATTRNDSATKGMDVAVGYDFARNANVAVGYTKTSRKVTGGKAKADVVTATLDYVVAPGWVAFAEVDHFAFKAPTAYVTSGNLSDGIDILSNRPTDSKSNHGTVFIVGTKLRF